MGFFLQPHIAVAKRHPGGDLPLPARVGVGLRYYSPSLGRWISCDPIGLRRSLNVVAMIDNDPIDWSDLLGLEKVETGPLGSDH